MLSVGVGLPHIRAGRDPLARRGVAAVGLPRGRRRATTAPWLGQPGQGLQWIAAANRAAVRRGLAVAIAAGLAWLERGCVENGRIAERRRRVMFQLLETTIDGIHQAMRAGEITCRQLVELYVNRIEAYDHRGPKL